MDIHKEMDSYLSLGYLHISEWNVLNQSLNSVLQFVFLGHYPLRHLHIPQRQSGRSKWQKLLQHKRGNCDEPCSSTSCLCLFLCSIKPNKKQSFQVLIFISLTQSHHKKNWQNTIFPPSRNKQYICVPIKSAIVKHLSLKLFQPVPIYLNQLIEFYFLLSTN